MKRLYKLFSSLKLTVWLLGFATALVFFGTLDQVHLGIQGALEKYFKSFIAIWQYPEQWPNGESLGWIHLPMLGGYGLSSLLIVNLFIAHFRYYKKGVKKLGIAMLHIGIVLLLIGQLITDSLQEEFNMRIDEGGQANFLSSFDERELVIIDTSGEETDKVISVPVDVIAKPGSEVTHPDLPFRLVVNQFYPNVDFRAPNDEDYKGPSPYTAGTGKQFALTVDEEEESFKQDAFNFTSADVEVYKGEENLGRYLLSIYPDNPGVPQLSFRNQRVEVDGRSFVMDVRFKRKYLPYHFELIDFRHDKYLGTEMPRNFSSEIRIVNPETNENRKTLIYMNHPLRYEGFAFFQASFDNQDTTTIFQVVDNPGWTIPYIACILVTLGMLWQFGFHLVKFAKRKRA
ncbi:MAG: cytochrome c biogenesis protein ResB [Verrucomicrobiota bacterium]